MLVAPSKGDRFLVQRYGAKNGHQRIICNDHVYGKHQQLKEGASWRCVHHSNGCRARFNTRYIEGYEVTNKPESEIIHQNHYGTVNGIGHMSANNDTEIL